MNWDKRSTYSFDTTIGGAKASKKFGVVDNEAVGTSVKERGEAIGIKDTTVGYSRTDGR